MTLDEAGRYEIDFRLRQKEREFQQAILLANGVRVEALADDGLVVPGQPVKVSVMVANNGAADVTSSKSSSTASTATRLRVYGGHRPAARGRGGAGRRRRGARRGATGPRSRC